MSVSEPSSEDDEEFDDLPETHLGDEDYDAYVAEEFDAERNVKEGPPVGMWIALFGMFVLVVAVLLLR